MRRLLGRRGDVVLLLRMVAWAALLPILKRAVPLPRLVRLMAASPRPGPRRDDAERVRLLSARACRLRPFAADVNCLERSLLAHRYLCRAGLDPRLVVGVRKEGETVGGHVWVTVGGAPATETRESIAPYTPVLVFGQNGETVAAAGEASLPPPLRPRRAARSFR